MAKTDPPPSRFPPGTIMRFVRFGVVGLSGVVVNQGLLMLLHGSLGAPLLLSSIVAIEISILTNFLLNHTWTWRMSLRVPGLFRRMAQYHAAAVMAAFAGNVIVLMAAVELFGVDYRIANLAGIAVGMLINFTAGEVWIFRGGRRQHVGLHAFKLLKK
jgi:dolichol-phosphate mannosyltransferase